MRCPLPDSEGDVLAYIGFLSLEGKLSSESLPQYISAVSRYHELHSLPSPTRTPLVNSLMRAYTRRFDQLAVPALQRIGCPAFVINQILQAGHSASDHYDLSCCTAVVIAFIFQVRAVSMAHLYRRDLRCDSSGLTASFYRRKGRSIRRPLILHYPRSSTWGPSNPLSLIERWFPSVLESGPAFPMTLSTSLHRALNLAHVQPPDGCTYSSHSPRIGGYNELLVLQFSKEYIMRRLDWDSEAMLRVYHDSRIVVTDPSRWFFAHLLT